MKKLNILDLHRTIHEKNERSSLCFEKVLEMSHNKIKKTTESKQLKCIFDVPSFIFGYPLFNINDCIAYVTNELKNNGFIVYYLFPNKLYISWDLEEIENGKKIAHHEKELVPLQKNIPIAAPSIPRIMKYKPSGKLELDLK